MSEIIMVLYFAALLHNLVGIALLLTGHLDEWMYESPEEAA